MMKFTITSILLVLLSTSLGVKGMPTVTTDIGSEGCVCFRVRDVPVCVGPACATPTASV
ncbi:hypothetical protein BDQ12DRAFT_684329 [Crucibulum laeve]|uniref:Uncharacterized protein n=1 Tax=Crucibulum laeve TaxID=68775 RepID=A0A5C3LZA8_9AGAR|nr:hypothetical protein BDQ12DRAFT_684329 [Crucibulum laeve]